MRALLTATLGLIPAARDLEPTLDGLQEQLLAMTDSNVALVKGFTQGTMTLQDFVTAAMETVPRLEALARAADLAGRPEIAAEYRAQAAELQKLGGSALRTAQGFQKFQTYAGYVRELAGAFAQLAGSVGNGDLEANLNGVANATARVADMAVDVAKLVATSGADIGAWVSLTVKVVSSIADAISGFQKARAEAAKAREDFGKQFSLINADAFSTFATRSRGFFADLFGGGPQVVREVNDLAANIAKAIESGVLGGFQNGIKGFLSGTGDLLTGIREGVRGALIDAVTQALIQGAILKGALGNLLTELTTTLAAGGDVTSIISQIGATLPGIAKTLEGVLKPIKTAIDKALPPTVTNPGSTTPSFGSGSSTFQAGAPTVVIDILSGTRDLIRGAEAASRLQMDAARLSYRAGEMLLLAAERMAGPHSTLTSGSR
ncbi:hypothetical protein [Deinococcus multiflagellatus]|uniref:Phage tail tape measure protein n=1 Tax=Deinococcus multiflagellatus TaxID=1656887 RepID=A0ABW1ZIK9_9DEIO